MCLHCQCLGVECRISIVRALTPVIIHCSLGYCYVFIAHQQRSMLMRDIDIANNVCLSVQCRIIHVASVANATGLGPQGGLGESGNLVRAFQYQKMFSVVQCPRGLAKAFIILV